MKLLVTGGAGFIGTNFVLRTAETRPDWQVRVLDALTYAGNAANLDAGVRPGRAGARQRRRRRPGRPAGGRHRRGRALRCGVAQRQLPRRPVAVRRGQRHRHLPPARGRAAARRPAAPRVDRRGVRRPRARRPAAVHRADAVQPVQPVLRHQGVRGPARAGVGPVVRGAARRCRTARTTTGPTSTSRSSSRGRSPTSCRASSPSSTARATNVRDWIHVDDHNDAVVTIVEQGRLGETYLIGADGERTTARSSRRCSRSWASQPTGTTSCSDRPGHDLRYAIDSSKLRAETGWTPKYRDIRAGLEADRRLVPRPRGLVACHQGARRADLLPPRPLDLIAVGN